jgi:hypothetical protein
MKEDIKTMNKDEFKQLEHLLGKLGIMLKDKYCIVPNVVHEGFHIGLYNKAGDLSKVATCATLEQTVSTIINMEK